MNLRETGPGSARHTEEHWVTAEKALDDEQKKSLRFVKSFFFDNPRYAAFEPDVVVAQLAAGQIKNLYEGAQAILRKDKEEVMKELGITERRDWNRCYGAALEINKRYNDLMVEELPEAIEVA